MSLPQTELDALAESTARLVRTVDGLSTEDWAAPSLLPGWSRAHVLAHLVLNAEGMTGAVEGLLHEEPVPVYASNERRDADIEELAAVPPNELRERLFASTTAYADTLGDLPEQVWSASVERIPGGPSWPVAELIGTRRREVEIHHADLGVGYTCRDWPEEFCAELIDQVVPERVTEGPFRMHATDLDREWRVGGTGGPIISGTACELAWWLVGRGDRDALSCDDGEVPRLGPWRRTPAPTPEE